MLGFRSPIARSRTHRPAPETAIPGGAKTQASTALPPGSVGRFWTAPAPCARRHGASRMRWLASSRGDKNDDHAVARACALLLGIMISWSAESYESDLNVARPAVLAVAAPAPPQRNGHAGRLVWVFADGLRLDTSRKMPVLNRLRGEGLDVVAH